ncbi:MAG: DUF5103 domain-containing protein [Salinivirgaceae bacterium]|nr:DUF5103 domain-containing protein [Salinivirgaceae bacterium]MDD4746865.1 DUF5103 domain-containing protein [Salinivirgaceae bacterium]MDY0279084.1 DUF5103 domain-containing protein [Salinivirgaceae bacterium]
MICFLIHGEIFAQKLFPSKDIVSKIWIETGKNNNRIFVPHIKTVQLYHAETPMSYPVLNINGESVLTLHFDDIDSVDHYYTYSIEQYDANWEIQNNDPFSFLEGFNNNPINDYQISGATSISYKHYTLNIPNDDLKITKSGNYLIKVYETSPQNPILTCRFSLYENKLTTFADLKMSHLGSMRNNTHKIRMLLNINQVQVSDIFSDIKIMVLTNNIWATAKTDIKPLFVRDNQIEYEIELNPHNEFRTLNLKELSQNYSDVTEKTTIKGIDHIKLPVDNFRVYTDHKHKNDMNGRNFIEKYNAWDANIDADYFHAYFTLNTDQPLLDGNIYIYGALSHYSLNPWNLMVYNADKKAYENSMLLKQGFHDYYYVHVNSANLDIDFDRIEGNAAQTSNDYLIYVYIRDHFTGTDNLWGFNVVTSFP